jgi:hypothetical protein
MVDALEEYRIRERIIKDRIRGVVHGMHNGLYLYGRCGTGKTHIIRTTLEALAPDRHHYVEGQVTYAGLFELIKHFRDHIIALDDVSALLHSDIGLQYLLSALGNPPGNGVRMVRRERAYGSEQISFAGGIIFASNLPLMGHHQPILAAIRDRIHVYEHEPPDECIIALCFHLASGGVAGLTPDQSIEVAKFLMPECQARDVRISVRLYVDKACKDYALWQAGNTETHWHDLIISSIEEQAPATLTQPQRDISRQERLEQERRIIVDIVGRFQTVKERVSEWQRLTGKKQASFYRRMQELEQTGQLSDDEAN